MLGSRASGEAAKESGEDAIRGLEITGLFTNATSRTCSKTMHAVRKNRRWPKKHKIK